MEEKGFGVIAEVFQRYRDRVRQRQKVSMDTTNIKRKLFFFTFSLNKCCDLNSVYRKNKYATVNAASTPETVSKSS